MLYFNEYISKDGSLYKVGDTIKINKPLSIDKFSFISDRFSQVPVTSKIIGNIFIIKNIIVTGFKNTGYELCMTINNPTTSDQILKFENAIENGEIKSRIMSSDDAENEMSLSNNSDAIKEYNKEMKYPKGFDFLGFKIRPSSFKSKDKVKTIPSIFISQKSKNSIIEKFKTLKIHKKRKTIEQVAKEINPIIRGIINYYNICKSDMTNVWR